MLRSPLPPLERWIFTAIGVLTVLILLLLLWGDQTVPRVRSFNWENQVVGSQDQGLILTFNRPMDRESVEANLDINPPLAGKFSWAGRRMAYTLEDPIPYGQTFTLKLDQAQDQFQQRSIPADDPFLSQFKSRDQAFLYLGVGEEENRLILYNLTRQEKQILTPPDLVVIDFEPYPDSDRILFSASDRVQYEQGNFDLQIYSVTTGLSYVNPQATEQTLAGQVKLLVPSDGYQNLKFDLSPDGKTIVVQRANKQNPGVDFGLWILREGKPLEPLETEPGGEFLITPDSKSMIMAQGQGLAVLPLESGADPLDFLPQFGRVMGLSPDGRQAAMVKFNTDYTRSLFLVSNQGDPVELWRTNGSILTVIFSPNRQILYCLGSQLLPGETYKEEPFFLAIDLTAVSQETSERSETLDTSDTSERSGTLSPETSNPEDSNPEAEDLVTEDLVTEKSADDRPDSSPTENTLPPEALTPLLKLPIQRNIAMSLSPDGIALLFDQINDTDPRTATASIDNARLWILPLLPDRFAQPDAPLPRPEVLPLMGIHPQWLP